MNKLFLIVAMLLTFMDVNAQKLYKDKTATLSAVAEKGYTCAKDRSIKT